MKVFLVLYVLCFLYSYISIRWIVKKDIYDINCDDVLPLLIALSIPCINVILATIMLVGALNAHFKRSNTTKLLRKIFMIK